MAGSGWPGEPVSPDTGCRQVSAAAWWVVPSWSYQPGVPLEANQSPPGLNPSAGPLVQIRAGCVGACAATCAPVS